MHRVRFYRVDHPEHFELRASILKFLHHCVRRGQLVGYRPGAVPSTDYDYARFGETPHPQVIRNVLPYWAIPHTESRPPKFMHVPLSDEELQMLVPFVSPVADLMATVGQATEYYLDAHFDPLETVKRASACVVAHQIMLKDHQIQWRDANMTRVEFEQANSIARPCLLYTSPSPRDA